jgi:hypothetical protein
MPANAANAPNASNVANTANATNAATRPDFSGTWKLDYAKSKMGELPGRPRSRTDVIALHGSEIVQVLYMDHGTSKDTTTYHYVADSSLSVNQVDGKEIQSHVWWQGQSLQVKSTAKLLVFDLTLAERWVISPDRATLVMTRHVKTPMGEDDQRLIFTNLDAPKADAVADDRRE